MKKLLFLLIAAFLSTSAFAQTGKMGKNVEQKIKRLSSALNTAGHPLTSTQKTDLTASFTNTMEKMKEARALASTDRSAIDRVKRKSDAEVKAILTPEQYLTFQNMKSNARDSGQTPKAGGAGSLGSKNDKVDSDKDQIPGWDEKQDHTDRRDKTEETSRELSDEEVQSMEERKRRAQERREERQRQADLEKANKAASDSVGQDDTLEKKQKSDKMEKAKSNNKDWAKENKKMSKRDSKIRSQAAVETVSNALANANMPLSDTQLKQVKTVSMQEQKKIRNLTEKSGEGSADYLKGLKKIKKGSVKKMKSFLSKEQYKFLKKAKL